MHTSVELRESLYTALMNIYKSRQLLQQHQELMISITESDSFSDDLNTVHQQINIIISELNQLAVFEIV